MGLRRIIDPVADAITIHTAKKQCEIGVSDSTHDTHLHRLIVGAVSDVERFTRRALITQTWEFTQNRFPAWDLALPRPPIQSVDSIEYIDDNGVTQTLSSSLYQVNGNSPVVVCPAHDQVWPSTRPSTLDAVTITFTAGYGTDSTTIPAEFQNVIAELVAFRFMNRGDVQGKMPDHIMWSLKSLRCGAMYDYYGVKN
jgi:uncharacterized phiE125 gp8 family phage protein